MENMKDTSQTSTLLSVINDDMEIIPKGKIAYFTQLGILEMHDFILNKFEEKQKENPKFTRAHLARRLHKHPAQITRWLNNPNNWENSTIHELILGICGGRLDLSVTKYADIPLPNYRQEDALEIPADETIYYQPTAETKPS